MLITSRVHTEARTDTVPQRWSQRRTRDLFRVRSSARNSSLANLCRTDYFRGVARASNDEFKIGYRLQFLALKCHHSTSSTAKP